MEDESCYYYVFKELLNNIINGLGLGVNGIFSNLLVKKLNEVTCNKYDFKVLSRNDFEKDYVIFIGSDIIGVGIMYRIYKSSNVIYQSFVCTRDLNVKIDEKK